MPLDFFFWHKVGTNYNTWCKHFYSIDTKTVAEFLSSDDLLDPDYEFDNLESLTDAKKYFLKILNKVTPNEIRKACGSMRRRLLAIKKKQGGNVKGLWDIWTSKFLNIKNMFL